MKSRLFTRNSRRASGAFSLVEAILATTILSIAVTGILTTFSSALVTAKIAEDYSKASTMMNELRGYLRADLFSPFDVNQGSFTLHPGYEWNATLMETEIASLYLVTLQITWKQGNRTFTVEDVTYHYYDITQLELAEE